VAGVLEGNRQPCAFDAAEYCGSLVVQIACSAEYLFVIFVLFTLVL